MTTKLRPSQVGQVRETLRRGQGNVCAICKHVFTKRDPPCLDHDHTTGRVRGVLHRSCNGVEGKIQGLAKRSHAGVSEYLYIQGLADYLRIHALARTPYLHPSHKTQEDKRTARNTKAREARTRKKIC